MFKKSRNFLALSLAIAMVLSFSLIIDAEEEVVNLRFASLAWQTEAIEANKEIVEEWNENNPNIQVEYVQKDWGGIHDYMMTGFETGEVPDIFHYESAAIVDWAESDLLTDLEPLMSEEMKEDIYGPAWESVELPDGGVYGVPFLWESRLTVYNQDLFEEAGVEPGTIDDPWTWEDLRDAAKKLTVVEDDSVERYGAGMGLRQPGSSFMNYSLSYNGGFVREEDGEFSIKVGEPEMRIMELVYEMLHEDESLSPDSIGQTASDMMPGFYAEKYAMVPAVGVWIRQQINQDSPDGFNWGIMPPLKGENQNQGANTQTLSIPEQVEHKEEAMEFIEFFLNKENMGRLAKGDWLLPTRKSTAESSEFQKEEDGWNVASNSAQHLIAPPWRHMSGFSEFKDRSLDSTLQRLFAEQISLEEAAEMIEREGNRIIESR